MNKINRKEYLKIYNYSITYVTLNYYDELITYVKSSFLKSITHFDWWKQIVKTGYHITKL